MLTLGSLFDGQAGVPLAGSRAGFVPLWASEIKPIPIAISKRRFPNMEHLGDITRIRGDKVTPVDVLAFTSPCTDLSVAGAQVGLDGKHSSLFFHATRIIDEMREATHGMYPKFSLWENVVGAFGSNDGRDFASVLESLVGAEVDVPARGWTRAGVVFGPKGQSAWRTFDAQFWGCAQRRARVYALTDYRCERAAEALFEPTGMPWHLAAGQGTQGENGQADTPLVTHHPARRYRKAVYAVDCRNNREVAEVSGTLQAKENGGTSLNFQNPIRIGWKLRTFTETELERLNGFPDGWSEGGTYSQRAMVAGNTVTVPIVEWIMRRVASALIA